MHSILLCNIKGRPQKCNPKSQPSLHRSVHQYIDPFSIVASIIKGTERMKASSLLLLLSTTVPYNSSSFVLRPSRHGASSVSVRIIRLSSSSSSSRNVVNSYEATTTTSNDAWVQRDIEASYPPLQDCVVGPSQVLIYDTTLRDGTQGESVSASCGTCCCRLG